MGFYVCATTSVYAIDLKVGPRSEPFMRVRAGGGAASTSSSAAAAPAPSDGAMDNGDLQRDPSRCALIIQDMQNAALVTKVDAVIAAL